MNCVIGHELVTSNSTWYILFGLDKHRQAFFLILYSSNGFGRPTFKFPKNVVTVEQKIYEE